MKDMKKYYHLLYNEHVYFKRKIKLRSWRPMMTVTNRHMQSRLAQIRFHLATWKISSPVNLQNTFWLIGGASQRPVQKEGPPPIHSPISPVNLSSGTCFALLLLLSYCFYEVLRREDLPFFGFRRVQCVLFALVRQDGNVNPEIRKQQLK